MTVESVSATRIWNGFCERFNVVKECIPLFEASDSGVVATRLIGRGAMIRPVLSRSAEMEAMVLREVTKLQEDWETKRHRLDGLIYLVGWKENNQFKPLYIGKAETFGRGDGNLSANLKRVQTDRSKFARWGDNYAYHVGDLSACVLPGHATHKQLAKYKAWAKCLFRDCPSGQPELKKPVYFWAKSWNPAHVGIWEELGPTSLAFLEYMLIGVAGRVSTELLNREGISRSIVDVGA